MRKKAGSPVEVLSKFLVGNLALFQCIYNQRVHFYQLILIFVPAGTYQFYERDELTS